MVYVPWPFETEEKLTFEMQKYLQPFLDLSIEEEIDFREDVDNIVEGRKHLHEDLAVISTDMLKLELMRRGEIKQSHEPQTLDDMIRDSPLMKGYDWEGEEAKRRARENARARDVATKLTGVSDQLLCDELNIRNRGLHWSRKGTPGTEEFDTHDLEVESHRRKMTKIALAVDPELLAQMFHEEYERLALHIGYQTREDSRVPWPQVSGQHRLLLINTCQSVLKRIAGEEPLMREELSLLGQTAS